MDDTQSVFGGQAFAQTNRKNQRPTARTNETPGVFGAVKWLGWIAAEHPGLSERARIVVLLLVELSARNEAAFPSLRWLSEHLGCSPGSVRAAIREAEQAGLVQRAERFDQRAFSGGRQTSNSYAIAVPRAALERPAQVDVSGDRGRVVVEGAFERHPCAQGGEATVARPGPTLASVRPQRGPLRDSAGAPCEIRQGVKDLRENLEEKANSTRECESATDRENAAAFLAQILPAERAQSLKLRFGVQAFGSLLFALKRKTCVEHPSLAASALERVEAARHVSNPGGYFLRILNDELAAGELVVGEPESGARDELGADETRALVKRIQELQAELACFGYRRSSRERSQELKAAQDRLRHLVERGAGSRARGEATPVAAPLAPEASLAASEPLSHAELSQELELLREAKSDLVERIERVCGFDGEAAERLRAELERVKARGREVLALLERLCPEASGPAEGEDPGEPSFTMEVGESGPETGDGDYALVTEEEMQGVRAELLVGAQVEPPTVLSTLGKVAEGDPSLSVTLEKLGGAAVFRENPEVAFRPLSQEELELSRRMQRAALLALREREDSGAASVAVPVEERGDENQRPGLAKVDPVGIGMGGIASAVAPAA